jgi:hypothetical protein
MPPSLPAKPRADYRRCATQSRILCTARPPLWVRPPRKTGIPFQRPSPRRRFAAVAAPEQKTSRCKLHHPRHRCDGRIRVRKRIVSSMEADLSLAPHRASFIEKIRGKRSLPNYFLLEEKLQGRQRKLSDRSFDATRIMPCVRDAVNNLLRRMIRGDRNCQTVTFCCFARRSSITSNDSFTRV